MPCQVFCLSRHSIRARYELLVFSSSATSFISDRLSCLTRPFRQLLVTVVRATFRFHDTTPQGTSLKFQAINVLTFTLRAGRMLNRFGKVTFCLSSSGYRSLPLHQDIETIDSSLAGSLQAVNSSLASFFAAILTVA